MSSDEISGAKLAARARKGAKAQIEALATEVEATSFRSILTSFFGQMAAFWRYSFNNQWLIVSQRPGATRVRGRTQWQREGREVREGEEPIHIYQPGSDRGWPFQVGVVFDLLQTDGPDGAPAVVRQAREWLPRVEGAAERLGITVTPARGGIGERVGSVLGQASADRVTIHPGLAPHERISVLCHEYAHVLLHLERRAAWPPYRIRELEAEACAHVVCQALEVPAVEGVGSPASYIRFTGGSPDELLRSLQRITAGAKAILTAIEGRKPRTRIPAWRQARDEAA